MMRRNSFLRVLVGLLLAVTAISLSQAEVAQPVDEKARIESLISHVGSLQEATFIRNGKEYDAKSAARFLRGKWDAHRKEIRTAADFIDKVATKSSTTGKAYVIRFQDGKEVSCGSYLTGRLKKF